MYNAAGKKAFLCNVGHASNFCKHRTERYASQHRSAVDSALQNLLFPTEIKKILLSYIKYKHALEVRAQT